MKNAFYATLLISLSVACGVVKEPAPLSIGTVTLFNYKINNEVPIIGNVDFKFIGNANNFNKIFHMTKASGGAATIPDFTTQSVVAIILQPTEKVVSVNIQKAEIWGEQLRIHYTITDTASFTTYKQIPVVVATVPKSIKVKEVSFFSEHMKEKTIPAF
ncbi:MAG: hypothetical protein M3040_13505 [Bacteroidota bacterium]|nr:hypothetical protein [Bacteroidota bacterium]